MKLVSRLKPFHLKRAGRKLHNKALFAMLRSPMRYFDTHPIGLFLDLNLFYSIFHKPPRSSFLLGEAFIIRFFSITTILPQLYLFGCSINSISGMIINRFSKDTYFMDERFNDVSLGFAQIFLLQLGKTKPNNKTFSKWIYLYIFGNPILFWYNIN